MEGVAPDGGESERTGAGSEQAMPLPPGGKGAGKNGKAVELYYHLTDFAHQGIR